MKLYSKGGYNITGGGCDHALVVLMVLIASAVLGKAQEEAFLSAHNNERASVGVAGLVWDSFVASYAQSYAEQQRDQANCALVPSGGPYGENIFWTGASSVSPTTVVNLWISQKQYYDYASNSCVTGKLCGLYTQVVWQTSLRLGCASITCNSFGGTFVICNYDPPGNVPGERPYSIDYFNYQPALQPSPSPSPPAPPPEISPAPYSIVINANQTGQPSPSPSPLAPYSKVNANQTGQPSPSPPASPAEIAPAPHSIVIHANHTGQPSPSALAEIGKRRTPSHSSLALIAIAIVSVLGACSGLGLVIRCKQNTCCNNCSMCVCCH